MSISAKIIEETMASLSMADKIDFLNNRAVSRGDRARVDSWLWRMDSWGRNGIACFIGPAEERILNEMFDKYSRSAA